ncbi:hypothetical protein CAPTEDRAFT_200443 [Capitella teleta]|uniref:BACK domain-containing protein n=1 Tax=Capitella teleta TaxID=283909 RepID=R7TPI9_CAPTE|nr:hypothetical protein CAPTEDRAFT_200443 [Capitella teleta]|eukprot:ELT95579.1 hypothetical protein CAPTEDRAFT_200443 [Capitella teleta]
MKESNSDEIEIKGIGDSTGLLVDYLYSETIQITDENAQALLAASDMLLLSDRKDHTKEYLCDHIEAKNCISLLKFSRLHELQDLIQVSMKFLTDYWQVVMLEGEIVNLQEDDLTDILSTCESEEDRFRLLQKWTKFNEERSKGFMGLVDLVKMSSFSKKIINSTVLGRRANAELKRESNAFKRLYTQLIYRLKGDRASNDKKRKTTLLVIGKGTVFEFSVSQYLIVHSIFYYLHFFKSSVVFTSQKHLDSENGYVKDDCIILEATIVADSPTDPCEVCPKSACIRTQMLGCGSV